MFQGDRCSLVIREAFQEDSGLYRVVAINSAGEATSACLLNVIRKPILFTVSITFHHGILWAAEEIKEEETPASSEVLVSVSTREEPPVFTQTFGNASVEEGGQLTFDCTITGQPDPLVSSSSSSIKRQVKILPIR